MESAEQKSTELKFRNWYRDYYQKKGQDRNDLLSNPGVLFQHLAIEDSFFSALRRATDLNRETAKILDVGCGDGGGLIRFVRLGFPPENLHGIDVLPERIDTGRKKYPNLRLVCGDATAMPFESDSFDLVMESTMFVEITDQALTQRMTEEMLRVTRPGGYLMLIDWRYGKPRNPNYLGVSRKRIQKMFSVGSRSDILCQTRGALIPPVGRVLSAWLPSAYFLLRAIFPFLVGCQTTLLRKRGG